MTNESGFSPTFDHDSGKKWEIIHSRWSLSFLGGIALAGAYRLLERDAGGEGLAEIYLGHSEGSGLIRSSLRKDKNPIAR